MVLENKCGKLEEWEEERWRIKDGHGEGTGNNRERFKNVIFKR